MGTAPTLPLASFWAATFTPVSTMEKQKHIPFSLCLWLIMRGVTSAEGGWL